MTIRDFIGDKVEYSVDGQMIFGNNKKGEQLLVNVRGWGAIKNLFDSYEEAMSFQDQLGEWFAEAINEKLDRESNPNT